MNNFWIRRITLILNLLIFLCDQDLCEGYGREALQVRYFLEKHCCGLYLEPAPEVVVTRSPWGPKVKVGIFSAHTFIGTDKQQMSQPLRGLVVNQFSLVLMRRGLS